ncbi:MAG TPA: hypothetical protein VLY45_03935 [Nitrospiria bacterium]|nr:hypothetical protein [Nitrospiria bacterium]
MKNLIGLVAPVVLGLLLSASALAADNQTVLMLGGDYCDYYPKELTDALMAVKGVTGVDLKSMKGHAIVSHDGTVKDETLITAVATVKGTKDGVAWYCTAMVMD